MVVRTGAIAAPTPHDQFLAGPHRNHLRARARSAVWIHRPPRVGFRVVERAIGKMVRGIKIRAPAPYDHFLARPLRGMLPASARCAIGGYRTPGVGGWIVFRTGLLE